MIQVQGLTKRFGNIAAVDDLTFDVRPGVVTGFLGPNGSGKSTTMRCMLELDRADHGATSFDGRPYRQIDKPLYEVGALLDAGYVHPGRSARNHLRWMAAANGIEQRRVDEVLDLVGLRGTAGKKVRSFSLGMRQRLGLAGVLLGDPRTIILDEPANGLDPEGIRWIRDMLSWLASDGRTVLVSSHQLSEIALIADDLVVIGRGKLIEQSTVETFIATHADQWVRVKSPTVDTLRPAVEAAGGAITVVDATTLDIRGMASAAVGELAAQAGLVLHELSPQTGSLEDAFLSATADAVEYHSGVPSSGAAPQPSDPWGPPA
ncbi:MAG: ATP-binding cassette domain-containing protein [Ilumatobacteraceae bacterium]